MVESDSSIQMNATAFDAWSIVHFVWGLSSGLLKMNPWIWITLSVGYEAVEYAHEWPNGSVLFGSKEPETPINLIGDIGVESFGYVIGRYIAERADRLGESEAA
jgi:hypothetical protein